MGNNKNNKGTTEDAELRHRAEQELGSKPFQAPPPRTEAETQRLLHELDVYRVELEMQNAELRRARDEAEAALEKYTDLYDFAPVGYFTLDRKGVVRAANLAGSALLGVKRSLLAGRSMANFLDGETRPKFQELLERAFDSGAMETCEVRILKENHASVFAQVEAVDSPSGDECRLAVMDISERKRMEDDLLHAQDDLEMKVSERTRAAEQANRTKSRFLANMSHELRTPMTGVLGMLDIALDLTLDPMLRDCIETASRSARSLLQILNDILDLTSIEEGKFSIEEKHFSLAECMKLVMDMLTPEARRKGIELSLAMGGDLPETVVGDQLRLRQILTNLVGNGVKFTEKGVVKVTVSAGEKRADGRREFTFTVADTGIGIPPDKLDLLFRPFSQVDDSSARQFGGTGLGLAICRELVERMGGRIDCKSEEGKGSSFSFTLPLYEEGSVCAALPAAVKSVPVAGNGDCLPGGRPRLLIAEDDEVTRKVFGIMLKNTEFEFDFAGDGKHAVEMLERGLYDLVIMDVQMPVMDGFEAAGVIRRMERKRGGHVPILAMTAHALREDEERCLAAGMDAYVSKPIDFRKCLEVIRGMLEKSG